MQPVSSLSRDQIVAVARGEFDDPKLLEWFDYAYRRRVAGHIASIVRQARQEEYAQLLRGVDIEGTFASFVQLEQTNPQVVQQMLAYPYVGSWANATDRDFKAMAQPHGRYGVSLPVLVAHLGCITASVALLAAAQTGQVVSFSVVVPVVRGMIRLPSLGAIRVGGKRTLVRLTRDERGLRYKTRNGSIVLVTLPEDLTQATDDWRPVWRLYGETNGQTATMILDDVNTHAVDSREGEPISLSAKDAELWQENFAEAWRILVAMDPRLAQTVAELLVSFGPMHRPSPVEGRSATAHDAFGAIMLTFPGGGAELARIMVHEVRHGLLSVITRHHEFYAKRGNRDSYAWYTPWRDDPRSVAATVDGVYAFAGEAGFWHYQAQYGPEKLRRRAAFELARWLDPTLATLQKVLATTDELTPEGQVFVRAIYDYLKGLAPLPLDPEIVAVAQLIEASHRLEWELRCHEPSGDWLEAYVQAARCGAVAPKLQPAWAATPDHPKRSSQARQDLLRFKTLSPEQFETIKDDFVRAQGVFAGLNQADVAFVNQNHAEAEAGYQAQIQALPESVQAWAGWALSRWGVSPPQEVRVAFWVHLALNARGLPCKAPGELVEWLTAS